MKKLALATIVVAVTFLTSCSASSSTTELTAISTSTIIETTVASTPTPTYTLNVNVSPSGSGSVSPPGGTYESGLQVALTATPANGYTFDYWDGAVSSSSPSAAVTMNSNKNATAHFKTLQASSTPSPQPTPVYTTTTTPKTFTPATATTTQPSSVVVITYSYSIVSQVVNKFFGTTQAKAGNVFVVFSLSITNNGYSEVKINPYDFNVIVNKIKYERDYEGTSTEFGIVNIMDGGQFSGTEVFQVPDIVNSTGCQFTYDPGYDASFKPYQYQLTAR
jgi:hypothetical protein